MFKTAKTQRSLLGILVCMLLVGLFLAAPLYGQKKKKGDYSGCMPTINAMNSIAGQAYPKAIGGKVEKPDFITGGGGRYRLADHGLRLRDFRRRSWSSAWQPGDWLIQGFGGWEQ